MLILASPPDGDFNVVVTDAKVRLQGVNPSVPVRVPLGKLVRSAPYTFSDPFDPAVFLGAVYRNKLYPNATPEIEALITALGDGDNGRGQAILQNAPPIFALYDAALMDRSPGFKQCVINSHFQNMTGPWTIEAAGLGRFGRRSVMDVHIRTVLDATDTINLTFNLLSLQTGFSISFDIPLQLDAPGTCGLLRLMTTDAGAVYNLGFLASPGTPSVPDGVPIANLPVAAADLPSLVVITATMPDANAPLFALEVELASPGLRIS